MNQYKIIFQTDNASIDTVNTGYLRGTPALASENEYVPIDCLHSGNLISSGDKRDFMYYLSVASSYYTVTRNFGGFGKQLFGSVWQNREWIKLEKSAIELNYIARHGILIHRKEDTDIPLMLIAVKKEYLFSIDRNNPDISQFCLLIDRNFINDEEHFKLYRNIKKHYIDEMEKHIDILYTNNLQKLCFNRKIDILPKVSTFTEQIAQMKELNSSLQLGLAQLIIDRKL